MPDDFLADVQVEGKEISTENMDEQGKATSLESPTEKKPMEESPSLQGDTESQKDSKNTEDDSKLPFHKHPRWKEMYEENQRLKTTVDELTSFKDETASRLERIEEEKTRQNVPDWFSTLYGENQEAWNAYEKHSKVEREAIKAEILQEQEDVRMAELAERKRWDDWTDKSIQSIEDRFSVDLHSENQTSVRNAFLKFTHEYLPTDENGNVDFAKSWDLFSQLQQDDEKKSQARKSLAARTMSDDKAESKPKDFLTSNDTRKMSWFGLGG